MAPAAHERGATNGTVQAGQRVRVHVNLHRKEFAIVEPTSGLPTSGRVIRYAQDVTLVDVEFRHQPACVRKIQEQGRRAVCAYAIGSLECLDTAPPAEGRYVRYNPHVRPDFHDPDTGDPVTHADRVVFVNLRAYVP